MSKNYSDYMIRPCGGGYQYCDGHCADCGFNNTTYSTTTSDLSLSESEPLSYKASADDDGISKPSREQYEKSKELKRDLSSWIQRSRKRQQALLDDLIKERSVEKGYVGLYEAHRDLVRRYELYEEIESTNG